MKKLYKTLTLTAIILALTAFTGRAQNAWLNEIHYDDFGTDTVEFIEIVIQDVENFDLSSFEIVLYNGSNGESYDTKSLDEYTVGQVENLFTFFYHVYPTNGIQNGEADGLALVYDGTVIPGQFLSWEGTLTAVDGPASGMTSVDIGVAEAGELEGKSLQLSGESNEYDGFTWQMPSEETMGDVNNDQFFLHFGLKEPGLSHVDFFPNPGNGEGQIFNPFSNNLVLNVFSVDGRMIRQITVKPGENLIRLENLASGIYLINLREENGRPIGNDKLVIR